MKARTKTINGKKCYFPSTGKDFTNMLKKKQLEQQQRETYRHEPNLTPEMLGEELWALIGKYQQSMMNYQILGTIECVKAKLLHEIAKHIDITHERNLCDSKHPDAPYIRCTKKRNHSGLCGTGGPDDNETMWDV